MSDIWLLVAAGAVVTYLWRGVGVLLSGHIASDSDIFKWISCVAYAMVAGLTMRIIVMPTGVLSATLLSHRLAACAIALIAFYATRRNLFVAVGAGSGTLIALDYLH